MSDLAKATEEAVAWALLRDAAREQAEAARLRVLEAMREAGSLKQEDPAGLGTITRTGGDDAAEVFDLEALTAWTVQHRPDQIQPMARPAWVHLLLHVAKTNGQAFDPETGAVVPGVRRIAKAPGLTIRTSRDAKEGARRFVEELTAGRIKLTLTLPQEEDDHGNDS